MKVLSLILVLLIAVAALVGSTAGSDDAVPLILHAVGMALIAAGCSEQMHELFDAKSKKIETLDIAQLSRRYLASF